MIFPERVFGRSAREHDAVGDRELADLLRHPFLELLLESVGPADAIAQTHERHQRLALHVVRDADHGRLGDTGCSTKMLSSSAVPMRCPATFTTSSTRPTIQK